MQVQIIGLPPKTLKFFLESVLEWSLPELVVSYMGELNGKEEWKKEIAKFEDETTGFLDMYQRCQQYRTNQLFQMSVKLMEIFYKNERSRKVLAVEKQADPSFNDEANSSLFAFFKKVILSLEIALPNEQLEKIYFQRPTACLFLRSESQDKFLEDVDVETPESKIIEFLDE